MFMVAILGPFSTHFHTHFSSFLCIWQRNKQKGMKNDVKNDEKMGYCEHLRKEILEKWSKNAFFLVFGSQVWSGFLPIFGKMETITSLHFS